MQEILRRRFKRLLAASEDGVTVASDVDGSDDRATDDGAERDGVEPDSATEEPVNEEGASRDLTGDPWARLPDLVIVDGGRPQLNAALAVIEGLQIGVSVIGIAKEDHGSISTHEEIYLPEQPDPLILPRGAQGLYLLQRIRDEAHRFAITYHRQVRSTRTFRSVLDEIPGIGPKRKKALLRHFGSARAIAAATVEELAAIDGMTRDAAERVKEQIGSGRAEAVES
jgi:excinuclease ABC subunit C